MKDTWQLYDYLRRRWLLMLLGAYCGALLGLGYFSIQDHPVEYIVGGDMVIEDPQYTGEGSPPTFTLSMPPVRKATSQAAIDQIRWNVAELANTAETPVLLRNVSIDEYPTGEPWWKAVVLGSIIGIALAIWGVYVLDDARSVQRRRQTGERDT